MRCKPLCILLLYLLILIFGCQKDDRIKSMLLLHGPESTGVDFANTLSATPDLNIITFEYFNNGAGVAIGDINRDGLPDLFFSGNMTGSKLYLNQGALKFTDITASSGIDTEGRWATGVTMVDLNEDGWLDIYVSCAGPYEPALRSNLLYINQQDGTFREDAAAWGLADQGHTTQTVFFDYDRDGDLDAYLLTNVMEAIGPNVIRTKKIKGESPNTDRLYRNEGGRFVDVSQSAGITIEGYGLGVGVVDINHDGWQDIYVSNDYLSDDLLYINQGDGTFIDVAGQAFRHTSYSSMGTDIADINNDTRPDIVSVDMLPPDNKRRKLMIGSIRYNRFRSEIISGYSPQYMRNTLQAHQGVVGDSVPVFSEIGQLAGIHSTDWSWCPLLADLDNDGWKDLLITNGYPKDVTNMDFASYKMATIMEGQWNNEMKDVIFQALDNLDGAHLPNQVFRNKGNFQFEDLSAEWGFTTPSYSHGAALGDLDLDGDLDYVVNNTNASAFIYENRQSHGNYLQFAFHPDLPPALLYGAVLTIYTRSGAQTQHFQPVRGYQSSMEPIIHFGLDTLSSIDSLIVLWADGHSLTLGPQAANQRLTISYSESSAIAKIIAPPQLPWMKVLSEQDMPIFRHQESHYSDFNIQPLLWQKYSQQGPPLAVADINGDQLEDFYVGGAFRQAGILYVQQKDGTFETHELPGDPTYEDVAAVFLDIDQDGDQDLYVGSGGSEFAADSPYYQDRIYLNDGHGHFFPATDLLPTMHIPTGCVAAEDYDLDGDIDLFVGGRIHPQKYAEIPKSFLLKNDNGIFRIDSLPENGKLGRISSAQWTDWDDNGRPDLVMVGEWMPVTMLLQSDTGFELSTLPRTTGLWNKVVIADIDHDEDEDLLVGNIGWNHPFGKSLTMYTSDIDQNGVSECLFTIALQGEEVPLHYRDDLLQAMAHLKKSYPDYTSYAETDWSKFKLDITVGMQETQIDIFASGWFENSQDSTPFHAFPAEAQWSPIYGWARADLDGDGSSEIIGVGNSYAPETSSGRMDASYGLVLSPREQGGFRSIPWSKSGFFCPGDAKSIELITAPGRDQFLLIVGRNNDHILAYRRSSEL